MSPWSVETESKEWILAPVCTWYHKSAWNYHRLGLCLWESTLQCNRYCGRRKPLNLLFRWSCSVMSHMFSEFSVWADTRTSGLVNELTQRLGDRRHLWKQNTGDSSLSLSPFLSFHHFLLNYDSLSSCVHSVFLSGLPLATYFSALKLKWLLDNVPAVRDAVERRRALFGTVDSWLIWV